MKVLVLSCSTGQGHDSCARAIKEHGERCGDVCEIDDAIRFVSPLLSRFMSWGHATMYKRFPWLFRFGYRFSERHPELFWKKSGIYRLFALGTDALHRRIETGRFDAVVCTHAFAAVMLTSVLRKHRPRVTTCLVNTDYTCNPCTKDSELDRYFIPDRSLADDFECESIDKERIRSVGIPLRSEFYRRVSRDEAKAALGIPAHHRHLAMMCGSMGCGPMARLARHLATEAPPDVDISIVCGTNRRLEKRLAKRYAANPRVHVRGFVRDMSLLMDSVDLCLTKPGGISITEAAVKRVPLILIDAVAGCEEANLDFFVRKGGAKGGSDVKELARLAADLLSRPAEMQAMRDGLASFSKVDSPNLIRSHLVELLEAKARKNSTASLSKTGEDVPAVWTPRSRVASAGAHGCGK